MGCDIHPVIEVRKDGKWTIYTALRDTEYDKYREAGEKLPVETKLFNHRNYAFFSWLCDVRNYSDVKPMFPNRGYPRDASEEAKDYYERWAGNAHSPGWITLKELLDVDFEQLVEDRRYTRQVAPNFFSGGATCKPGEGQQKTLRNLIGEWVLKDIQEMATLGGTGGC